MKYLLPILCLFGFLFSDTIDAVYLNNGSVIKGLIIENVKDDYIKIESGKNILTYNYDEILKVEIKSQKNKLELAKAYLEETRKKIKTDTKKTVNNSGIGMLYYNNMLSVTYKNRGDFNNWNWGMSFRYGYDDDDGSLSGYTYTLTNFFGYDFFDNQSILISIFGGINYNYRTNPVIERWNGVMGIELDCFYNNNVGFSIIAAFAEQYWFNSWGVVTGSEYKLYPGFSLNINF